MCQIRSDNAIYIQVKFIIKCFNLLYFFTFKFEFSLFTSFTICYQQQPFIAHPLNENTNTIKPFTGYVNFRWLKESLSFIVTNYVHLPLTEYWHRKKARAKYYRAQNPSPSALTFLIPPHNLQQIMSGFASSIFECGNLEEPSVWCLCDLTFSASIFFCTKASTSRVV